MKPILFCLISLCLLTMRAAAQSPEMSEPVTLTTQDWAVIAGALQDQKYKDVAQTIAHIGAAFDKAKSDREEAMRRAQAAGSIAGPKR